MSDMKFNLTELRFTPRRKMPKQSRRLQTGYIGYILATFWNGNHGLRYIANAFLALHDFLERWQLFTSVS